MYFFPCIILVIFVAFEICRLLVVGSSPRSLYWASKFPPKPNTLVPNACGALGYSFCLQWIRPVTHLVRLNFVLFLFVAIVSRGQGTLFSLV